MFIRITRFHVKVLYYWDQEGKLVNQSFMWCNFLFRLLLKEAFDSERLPRRFHFVFPLCFLWQHASKFQTLIWKIFQHKSFTAKKTDGQNQPQNTWLIEWMAVKKEEENGAPYQEECLKREKGGGGVGKSKKEEGGRREEMERNKTVGRGVEEKARRQGQGWKREGKGGRRQ